MSDDQDKAEAETWRCYEIQRYMKKQGNPFVFVGTAGPMLGGILFRDEPGRAGPGKRYNRAGRVLFETGPGKRHNWAG